MAVFKLPHIPLLEVIKIMPTFFISSLLANNECVYVELPKARDKFIIVSHERLAYVLVFRTDSTAFLILAAETISIALVILRVELIDLILRFMSSELAIVFNIF
jgi:hypothetical protein